MSLEQKPSVSPSAIRQTFYVRVCLGYLTGIKMEALKRRKNSTNNLVVGYAALAKSGKRLALSQPIGPAIDGREQKSLKLFWAKPKGAGQSSSENAPKRRLHFSLKLERETDRDTREEESLNSLVSYNPEVVKIVIGLKCGEERYPLGIANLVINGREVSEQKVDMALRPVSETSFTDMQQQQKARLGIFGGGKKIQGVTFKSHDQQYWLASNSTLRVRLDVKAGEPGANKALVWGENGDDASYITNFSFDTKLTGGSVSKGPAIANQMETTLDRQSFHQQRQVSQQQRQDVSSEVSRNAPASMQINDSQQNSKQNGQEVPLKFVVVQRHASDERSCTSSLTSPQPGFCSSLCLPLCFFSGEANESTFGTKRRLASSFSFEDDNPSRNRSGTIDTSLRTQSVSTSSSDESSTEEDGSEVSEDSNERRNETTQARDRQTIQPAPRVGLQGDENSASAETVDITVETYEDLKDAQATLLRYAKKVGMNMDDLLDTMHKEQATKRTRKQRS